MVGSDYFGARRSRRNLEGLIRCPPELPTIRHPELSQARTLRLAEWKDPESFRVGFESEVLAATDRRMTEVHERKV